ncbi:NFAT activation molecule 1 isoform X2 [Stigmatopora argus]
MAHESRLFFSETVFVAIRGEVIHIPYELHIPAKENNDVLICFDPNNQQFFRRAFPATGEAAFSNKAIMELGDLRRSGEYRCQYKEAKAYFFLRLRDEYYKDFTKDTFAIVMGFFIGVLLIFSVVSSLYVFRGTWAGKKHERGNPSNDRKKNKQQADKPEEDRTGVIVTSSTSLYASLESRPRSIYDVLDRSSVNNTVSNQKKPALMPKTGHTPAKQTQSQDEGLFESVYENF